MEAVSEIFDNILNLPQIFGAEESSKQLREQRL